MNKLKKQWKNKDSKYFKKYKEIREPNLHKMKPIPVCIFPKKLNEM